MGFDSLLANADEANECRFFLKTVAHLPGTWEDSLPYYRNLLEAHHFAMLEADQAQVVELRDEARNLAIKLNGGAAVGICAADGYGKRLEEATASTGEVPKWGQAGSFILDHDGIAIRIDIDGLFGIGSMNEFWPGFKVHAVDRRKPFLSESGFRSFRGYGYYDLIEGLTIDRFVEAMLTEYVDNHLGGKLLKIKSSLKLHPLAL